MVQQGAQLVDVLLCEEYEEEHLPGAINITPLGAAARTTASSPDAASPRTLNSGTDESSEIMPFLKMRGPCEEVQRAERRELCGFNGVGGGLEKECRFLVQQSQVGVDLETRFASAKTLGQLFPLYVSPFDIIRMLGSVGS
jgi:hypothetical protein